MLKLTFLSCMGTVHDVCMQRPRYSLCGNYINVFPCPALNRCYHCVDCRWWVHSDQQDHMILIVLVITYITTNQCCLAILETLLKRVAATSSSWTPLKCPKMRLLQATNLYVKLAKCMDGSWHTRGLHMPDKKHP